MKSKDFVEHSILVVEDELPLQEVIRIKLENSGLRVVTARSVKQALSYLEEVPSIDVIWLDHYLLGQENGLQFVVRVKEEGSPYQSMPIFVVSNSIGHDKISTYIRLGVRKYYTKTDFTLAEIVDDIKQYVGKIKASSQDDA